MFDSEINSILFCYHSKQKMVGVFSSVLEKYVVGMH